jgi:hypothetical protein
MIVTHKDVTKKTHLVNKWWNKTWDEYSYSLICGSGIQGSGNKEASYYEFREIDSTSEIAEENLCTKCFKKVVA